MVTTNPVVGTLTGYVNQVNERGLKLDGHDGWLNISKYAEPAPQLAAVGPGVTVVLGLDKAGYIRTIECMDEGPAYGDDEPPLSDAEERIVAGGQAAANGLRTTTQDTTARIAHWTLRTAAITASVQMAVARGKPDLKAVMADATDIERWITR